MLVTYSKCCIGTQGGGQDALTVLHYSAGLFSIPLNTSKQA